MAKTILITASDENFVPLLDGLLNSLAQRDSLDIDIGLLDVGISEKSLETIRARVDYIQQPEWDLPVPENLRTAKPHLRALTARPFLPNYFPGYDVYIWMDCDTWIQRLETLELFIRVASNGALAIVPEIDRSYKNRPYVIQWRLDELKPYFSSQAFKQLFSNTYYNSGVFALGKDSDCWEKWAETFYSGLSPDSLTVSDQAPLNAVIWKSDIRVHPLPAICNWCCHLASPVVKGEKLYTPYYPHEEIGIIHMTGETKDAKIRYKQGDQIVTRSLRHQ